MAFTAERWGNAAVVCRAMENRPGLVVDPQFGLFETWTHAHVFALRLNEGLDIDPREARQIVTSSVLAMACVLDEARPEMLKMALQEDSSASPELEP